MPPGTPPETLDSVRQLLLAEDAMLNVVAWAKALSGHPDLLTDRRARMVAAAGLSAMFSRPFMSDNTRMRLEPDEWRERIADDPEQTRIFDRLWLRRNKVFAHSDTDAGVVNVTDTNRFFKGPRQPADPYDLRVYDVGADGGLLEPESLRSIGAVAARLAALFEEQMLQLGAVRVRSLV